MPTTVNQDIPEGGATGGDSENVYIAGDSLDITVPVTTSAGDVVDLSGVDVYFTIVEYHGTTPLIVKSTTDTGRDVHVPDPSTGIIEIAINPRDTLGMHGTFYHETRLIDRDGNVATVAAGEFVVTEASAEVPDFVDEVPF